MYTLSATALKALRSSHQIRSTAMFQAPGSSVPIRLPVGGGSVTYDTGSAVRGMLNVTLPPTQELWDLLDSVGGEVSVSQAFRFIDTTTETIPLGVFVVDSDQMGYASGDSLSLTCPDRWVKVQRAKFGLARTSVPTNMVWQEIKRLVEGAWSGSVPFPGWAQLDTSATGQVGPLVWDDGDREGAILDLAKANSLEVFFDRTGKAVLRPVPQLTSTSVEQWRVDAGDTGVMVGADRSRDRSKTFNAVIVTSTSQSAHPDPIEVKNTTDGDPLSVSGPLGYVPYYYETPNATTPAQMQAAGRTILSRVLGEARQLSLENVVNPALDPGDVIGVVLPQIDRNTPRPYELHIIDSVTVPLSRGDGDTQHIQTRSTRPDTDGQ